MFNSSPNESIIFIKVVTNSRSNNSLISAIKCDRIEEFKLLVKNGADVNEPGQNNVTPLHVAAKHGRYMMMKILIENGACLDSTLVGPKERRFMPLHLAVLGHNLKCMELLLHSGARVSPKIDVCHPIHLAVFKMDVHAVKLLLDYGADVNLRFYNNFFKEFRCPIDRRLWLDHNLPLLHYSILLNLDLITNLLLSYGADINIKTSLEKTTLMHAVEVENVNLVEFLVEKKHADVNERDVFGQPVLHFSVVNGKSKVFTCSAEEDELSYIKYRIIETLVENGADINARFPANKEKTAVINYVIKYGYTLAARFLLQDTKLDFNEINLEIFYSWKTNREGIKVDFYSDGSIYVNIYNEQLQMILYYLLEKAVSLKMIGSHAGEKLLLEYPSNNYFASMWYSYQINSFKNKFMQMANYMKKIKIDDTNITIWYLLTCKMENLVGLMANEKFKNFKIDQYSECDEMSYYFNELKERLTYAKHRKVLLGKSTELISVLFINYLPFDCCDRIANCLTNRELHLFWLLSIL